MAQDSFNTRYDELADSCAKRIAAGEICGVQEFRELPFTDADRLASYIAGASYLREIMAKKGF